MNKQSKRHLVYDGGTRLDFRLSACFSFFYIHTIIAVKKQQRNVDWQYASSLPAIHHKWIPSSFWDMICVCVISTLGIVYVRLFFLLLRLLLLQNPFPLSDQTNTHHNSENTNVLPIHSGPLHAFFFKVSKVPKIWQMSSKSICEDNGTYFSYA